MRRRSLLAFMWGWPSMLVKVPVRLAATTLLAVVLAGCGPDRPPEAATCGPVLEEPLDPGSAVHLLPGAPEPDYLSEPPTSGPHLAGPAASGVLRSPLAGPAQVRVLEQGGVLVQHRDLDHDSVAALAGLAGDRVVVAPNPDLDRPVVATAWRRKLVCDDADLASLRRFVDDSLGAAGGHPPR